MSQIDRPMPPAPEGCVYGPWWDGSEWLCLAPHQFLVSGRQLATCVFWAGRWQQCTDGSEAELLRLAKENQALKDQNKKLVEGLDNLQKAATSFWAETLIAANGACKTTEDALRSSLDNAKALIAEHKEGKG